ncbi:hypothetical protein LTR17_011444 [Elasticomyces elasticus]|nr:hypothetical protein LTR17_011444 [Elasticomyces elasticus]
MEKDEPNYTKVHACVVYASDEPRFKGSAYFVGSALEGLGFGVRYIVLADVPPGQLLAEFSAWVREKDDDDSTIQLVLAYFGHGCIRGGRLWACNHGPRDDFTALQEYLRDDALADALTILGTCKAGVKLRRRANNHVNRDMERFETESRIVETLASSDNTITNSTPWVARLVTDLCVEKKPRRVRDIHESIRTPSAISPSLLRNELENEDSQNISWL